MNSKSRIALLPRILRGRSRRWTILFASVAWVVCPQLSRVSAQTFNSGSDGSDGPLEVTTSRTLPVPPEGIFHFTTINIASGAILTFTPNALNTPVYLLATSNVTINGGIDVSGKAGSSAPGLPGPGGFGGGHPSGDGLGPGSGRGGKDCTSADCAGGGSYAAVAPISSTNVGAIYGSPLLIPLVGGSGGGGGAAGGGGGGGAILVASSTRITFPPRDGRGINAQGGGNAGGSFNGGSGGAIRLVAPVISGGEAYLRVDGGAGGGSGRVRIDTLDRTGSPLASTPPSAISFGKVMTVFGPVQSRLNIVAAAGQDIPEGTNAPVTVFLPFGSDTNQIIKVQARDFAGIVPINVVVTPQNGPRRIFPAEINTASANPPFANVNVTIPLNTEAVIHAWTR